MDCCSRAPLSMRFPRQEYWNGLHFLLQEILLTQGSNPGLLVWRVDSLPLHHLGSPPLNSAKSLQSCPTLRPHRRQPTRFPRPWDSPGKNTGVGCHFHLQCMKVKSESEVAQSLPSPPAAWCLLLERTGVLGKFLISYRQESSLSVTPMPLTMR